MDALFNTPECYREELEAIERLPSDEGYLNVLAAAAIRPHLTSVIFASHEDIFPEICARWVSSCAGSTASAVLLAFTRILPFAPYLVSVVDQQLTCRRVEAQKDAALSFLSSLDLESSSIPDSQLQSVLLAFFRLLHFDQALFARAISPSRLQLLFNHENRVIRYLSIRLFGLYVRAATALVQDWISRYLGEGEVAGEWEGRLINYLFLE
jgi:midasin